MAYKPIENYGVIGDLNTVALVGIDGSIDFMCFPFFDSPTIFAALLDHEKGGRFQVAPLHDNMTQKQLYMPDSNILLTRFLSSDGIAEVSDFMPIRDKGHAHDLVRRVKTIRGEIRYRMVFDPRFDYGRAAHQVDQKPHYCIFKSEGPDQTTLRLRSQVPVRIQNGMATAEFTLSSGQTASFVLEDAGEWPESPSDSPDYVSDSFKETLTYWQTWTQQSCYQGRWREMVSRSAMILKLLTSAPHGSFVAAPTFGLPEDLGGVRNWDYRYTWIRDSSFAIYALMRLGYRSEAVAFMNWIDQRCHELEPGHPLQIMYRINGDHNIPEMILDHFEGYKQSKPVRIGNAAYQHLQLDIYGELMDAVYICNQTVEPISYDLWMNLARLIDWVCDHWREPDEGIWEVRGGRREFLHSRLMCWVAIDRGMRLARDRSFPAPVSRWRAVRDEIFQDIYDHFWDRDLCSFVQYKGAKTVDASALLMPLAGFIGARDPRWCSTLSQITKSLVEDSLVYRYDLRKGADTGFPGHEGTFSICSFWYAECLARAGDLKQARFNFEKTLSYANHLGLFAEEIGPDGKQLGNFPQAFTHLGLVSAAVYLDEQLKPGE